MSYMLCKPCVHVVNTSSMDTVVHEDNVQHCVQSLGEHHTGSILCVNITYT